MAALVVAALSWVSLTNAQQRPGMAYEFSAEGFDRFTRQVIIPWMFGLSQSWTVGGINYSKLAFSDANF